MKRSKTLQACLAFVMLILSVFLMTGCGSDETGHWLPSSDSEKQLVSINVTPSAVSVPIGATRQFIATAAYDDGTSADVTATSVWASGSTSVATVNSTSGLATGVTAGTAIITAAFGGKSDTATLTVLSDTVTLSSIVVTPATPSILIGLTQTFVATGHYSDGSSANISTTVAWTSGTPGVATVNGTSGLATGVTDGTSIITASLSGKSGSATLTVLPPSVTISSVVVTPATASIPVGLTQTFVATIFYSDGRSVDVSNNALTVWTSSAPGVATVVSPGVATGVAVGTTTITATVNCGTCESIKAGSATLTVTAARLMRLVVTPDTASVAIGSNRAFVATGYYSDGTSAIITTSVNWSPGSTSIATVVSNTGIATGVAVGSTHIIATSGSVSDYGVLTVTDPTNPLNPSCTGPGPVDMGAAASFGVLVGPAGSATLTNNGLNTTVNGDVGAQSQVTAPALGAGFVNYTGTAPIYMAARTDMLYAISCASARACDYSYGTATDFATIVTLLPGVHCVTGAMSVGSNLVLNTPGLYIFKSTGALTSANTISVTYGSGVNATNTWLFWVPTGAASIGTNNAFIGTIMPDASAAVTLGANTVLIDGRALSYSAVTLNTNTITIP
jgi:uncharacterized protein YjdB